MKNLNILWCVLKEDKLSNFRQTGVNFIKVEHELMNGFISELLTLMMNLKYKGLSTQLDAANQQKNIKNIKAIVGFGWPTL